MATFNLVRNSRLFFTTNVNANTGVVASSGFTTSNTREMQVLDGFSFSQATNAETVEISEAGTSPVRGQRSFNTSLGNVEISFSTYVRPNKPSTTVLAEESLLWNALLSADEIGTTVALTGNTSASYNNSTGVITITGTGMTYAGAAVGDIVTLTGMEGVDANRANVPVKINTLGASSIDLQVLSADPAAMTLDGSGTIDFHYSAWTDNLAVPADTAVPAAYGQVTSAVSNRNQLQVFGLIFLVDGIAYAVDNCALDQASIDFGLDGIAMISWTAKGTALRQLAEGTGADTAANPSFTGPGLTGTAQGKDTTAKYITQKLSTVSLASEIGGGGIAYTLALTGGNLTVSNNINYITPANLGVVNKPIGYYTGTRSITGNLTAYLRTGSTNTAGLLSTMLANSSTEVDPKFKLTISIGGAGATRVETMIQGAMLQIPTVDAQAVMSTTINFTAQGTDYLSGATAKYDIENTNDLRIRYFSAA